MPSFTNTALQPGSTSITSVSNQANAIAPSRQARTSSYLDSQDQFDTASAKLRSLLAMLSGEGFQAFKNLSGDTQQNLMWLASDLVIPPFLEHAKSRG